jgi:hypothetical protein
VTDTVQFAGGHPDLDLGLDHFQYLGGEAPGDAHALYLICCLDRCGHH